MPGLYEAWEAREPKCCCLSPDAEACLELREYGYSPAMRLDADSDPLPRELREECQCSCHEEFYEERP